MPVAPDLTGRVAVVTGASRGVGAAVAYALAAAGAQVASLSRGAAEVGLHIATDVSDPRAVQQAKEAVAARLGPVAVLVNAAGCYGPISMIKDSDPTEWINVLMVNTVGSYLTCRAFVPDMIEQGWGRIVNLTSAASLHPPGALNSAYATSKVALNQFTRHLAAELAGTGVTANVLHPGDLKTDIWTDISARLERLGPIADPYRDWVSWVERTGGDPVDKPAAKVLNIVAGSENGRFHWIDDPLQAPIPSWPEGARAPQWNDAG